LQQLRHFKQFNYKDVVFVQSGIGKVNAAVTASLLIEKFDVNEVIFSGVAGSLDERLKGFCTREFGNNVVHYNRTALFESFKDVDRANVERLLVDQLDHYLSVYTQTEETSSKPINSSLVYVPVKSETYECEPFIFNTTVISIITEEEQKQKYLKKLIELDYLLDYYPRNILSFKGKMRLAFYKLLGIKYTGLIEYNIRKFLKK